MSGAAGIAAAKNRRTKPDPNQKPIISCSTKTGGACPMPQQNNKTPQQPQQQQPKQSHHTKSILNQESLQITGPMPLVQVLAIHEQRLNKIDEELKQKISPFSPNNSLLSISTREMNEAVECNTDCNTECYDRLHSLEEKVRMLEEVIMNLQITLTNVQSFSMETNLSLMKLQKVAQLNEQIQPKLQNISLSIKETVADTVRQAEPLPLPQLEPEPPLITPDTIAEPVIDDTIVLDKLI